MSDEKQRLNPENVTLVYSLYNHLGDFVVMAGLLKKFDLLGVEFESVIAHRGSPHVSLFDGNAKDRFFNISTIGGFVSLLAKLRRQKKEGRFIFGLPMASGSVQAFLFFWILKKLGGLTYIVDFNLINADVITPPRRRYIFDRHLAQAAELFGRPEWLEDTRMPLALASPAAPNRARSPLRMGLFPWSGRRRLPEFRWPDSHWAELAKLILENTPGEVALLGSDPDFAAFESTLRHQLSPELRARFLSLPANSVPALLGHLEELDCLITVNSSALHLAHALQLPVIALCGSSAEFWLPEGGHVCLVRDEKGALPPSDNSYHDPLQPSLQRIAVREVYSALQELSTQFNASAR